MKKTKIVCTIGPASLEVETLKQMMKAGMNVARINFSHGSYPEQNKFIEAVKKAREELGATVALGLDMQGPELRTGKLKEQPIFLEAGQTFKLYVEDVEGDINGTSVSYKDLYKDIKVGTKVLIDDGLIGTEVQEIKGTDIILKVINGGKLGSRKSINIPGTSVRLPALKEKDIKDLEGAAAAEFDYVFGSFIRDAKDVKEIRKVLDDNGGKDIKIVCKIENQEGIDNIEEIVEASDGIMVARGDMAVEVPFEKVPAVQKMLIKECKKAGKVVIVATQMLESMQNNPRPTRAEVSDVANAIYDETDAIMLSGESAMGQYPVVCVETMSKIANEVEGAIHYWNRFKKKPFELDTDEEKLNYSLVSTADSMGAQAIIVYAETGRTVGRVSSTRPGCKIYAVTSREDTARQLIAAWGVVPIVYKEEDSSKMIKRAIEELQAKGELKKGDLIITSGEFGIDTTADGINRQLGNVIRL
jgi:pyruvate kinase